MSIKSICGFVSFPLCFFLPYCSLGQLEGLIDTTRKEEYYVGINPIAPFTCIRSEFTTLYLPAFTNLEAGLSVFVGKIWDENYNVETRLSYGSPKSGYNLFQVQSGFNYCFNRKRKQYEPYAGLFLRLYNLYEKETEVNYSSAGAYICVGNRFNLQRFFIDLRLNQNVYVFSWSDVSGSSSKQGFYLPIYGWKSSYMPCISFSVGYRFK